MNQLHFLQFNLHFLPKTKHHRSHNPTSVWFFFGPRSKVRSKFPTVGSFHGQPHFTCCRNVHQGAGGACVPDPFEHDWAPLPTVPCGGNFHQYDVLVGSGHHLAAMVLCFRVGPRGEPTCQRHPFVLHCQYAVGRGGVLQGLPVKEHQQVVEQLFDAQA